MSVGSDSLVALYPAIRQRIAEASSAARWPEFEYQIDRYLTTVPLPVPLLLPVASAAAVGGEPEAALSVSAACGLGLVALRWLDDLADRDRDSLWCELGPARTLGFATAALTLAGRVLAADTRLGREVQIVLCDHLLALGRGQDADLRSVVALGLEEVTAIAREKTGAGVAFACRAGALAGGADTATAEAFGRLGEHLGVALQALDDLDGCFHPAGRGDLAGGKVTLAVAFGLTADHPWQAELAEIVASGRLAAAAARVREILETIETREHLVGLAFAERRAALALLASLPLPDSPTATAGRSTLVAFAEAVASDWRALLERSAGAGPSSPVPDAPRYFEPWGTPGRASA